MKKGQGLSMNVIIIAAIALLILVILTTLVIRSGGDVSKTGECTSIPGAYCDDLDVGEACDEGYTKDTFKQCADDDRPTCCVPVGAQEE